MRNLSKIVMLFVYIYSSFAFSAIQVMTTRVIINSDAPEQTFVVRNTGEQPSLVQIWLSKIDYDGMDIRDDVPLFVTPPVARINRDKNKVFRLFQSDDARSQLPDDRESAFWINIFDLPSTEQEEDVSNKLNIAFRTRIKAFYRPVNIEGTLIESAEKLQWTVKQKHNATEIIATNNSPYHISFANIALMDGEKEQAAIPGGMVAPFSTKRFTFNNVKWSGDKQVRYRYISDLGAFITVRFAP